MLTVKSYDQAEDVYTYFLKEMEFKSLKHYVK